MKIGYPRVSTQDQNLDMQIDDLRHSDFEMIFEQKILEKSKERP